MRTNHLLSTISLGSNGTNLHSNYLCPDSRPLLQFPFIQRITQPFSLTLTFSFTLTCSFIDSSSLSTSPLLSNSLLLSTSPLLSNSHFLSDSHLLSTSHLLFTSHLLDLSSAFYLSPLLLLTFICWLTPTSPLTNTHLRPYSLTCSLTVSHLHTQITQSGCSLIRLPFDVV